MRSERPPRLLREAGSAGQGCWGRAAADPGDCLAEKVTRSFGGSLNAGPALTLVWETRNVTGPTSPGRSGDEWGFSSDMPSGSPNLPAVTSPVLEGGRGVDTLSGGQRPGGGSAGEGKGPV